MIEMKQMSRGNWWGQIPGGTVFVSVLMDDPRPKNRNYWPDVRVCPDVEGDGLGFHDIVWLDEERGSFQLPWMAELSRGKPVTITQASAEADRIAKNIDDLMVPAMAEAVL